MIYTVIYIKEETYHSTVVQSVINRAEARQLLEQEYGEIIALVPGAHPVYF